MILQEIKQTYSRKLRQNELDVLISFVIKKSKEFIFSHPELKLSKTQREKLKKLVKRRGDGEPLAYITGKKEFYGLDFLVNKNVLIPRPETELMIKEVIKEIKEGEAKKTVLDIGSGSGNIIISTVKNIKSRDTEFLASDISIPALYIARKNARKHKALKKIKFYTSNLLNNKQLLKKLRNTKTLIIAANLPYVPAGYLKNLSSFETRGLKYEPKIALAGGKDGLNFYKKLISQILKLKKEFPEKKILAFLEIIPEQKNKLEKWKKENDLNLKIKYFKDLSKKWRIVKMTF